MGDEVHDYEQTGEEKDGTTHITSHEHKYEDGTRRYPAFLVGHSTTMALHCFSYSISQAGALLNFTSLAWT